MKKILTILSLCFQYGLLNAQQWIDKIYDYDSTLNVTYGTAINYNDGIDTLTMDIYSPVCDDINHLSRRPLLMWIHGGALLAGDKNELTNMCKQFTKRGYVTASINYRLGFISDNLSWSCNYPNYSCVFATDSAEWYRSYFRATQDAKGALRYLINRNGTLKIDTNNIFLAGESAGAFLALGVGLLDTIIEKPIQAYAINNVIPPNNNSLNCQYNLGKTFATMISRPDLGNIDGNLEPTNITFNIKGIGNMYGAMFSDLLKYKPANKPKTAIFSFHQPCDLVVPIDSGSVYAGLSWCMTNGYNCHGIANTATLYGSRAFSNWNIANSYGYNIHNEFTETNFPYNFLFGTGSCADQINNPCHAYDNNVLRENNLAVFFASLITTNSICDTTLFPNDVISITNESKINIYPNPCEDVLNINYEDFKNCTITIYDMMGKKSKYEVLLQNKHTQILLNDLHSGIYFILVKKNNCELKFLKLLKV